MTVDELAKVVMKLVEDMTNYVQDRTGVNNALLLANSALEKALGLQKLLIDRITLLEARVANLEDK